MELVERHHLLDHAHGLRAGIARLRAVEHDLEASERCNVYLFCDPDVIFRSADALRELGTTIVVADAALAGEWRGRRDDPDIQASFVAVRSDVYSRPDVIPPVHHGSPTRWMQRSIASVGDLVVAQFASNHGGFVLHRGRSAAPRDAPLHGRTGWGDHLERDGDAPGPAAPRRRRAGVARSARRAAPALGTAPTAK